MTTEIKKTNKPTAVKKQVRYSARGRIYISATFNNTLITVTDESGKTLCWSSCGKMGYSGTRKSTPFAASTAMEAAIKQAQEKHGLNEASIYIKGAGPGREAVLRYLRNVNIEINKIVDVTPIPHDGIRPKKRRRS